MIFPLPGRWDTKIFVPRREKKNENPHGICCTNRAWGPSKLSLTICPRNRSKTLANWTSWNLLSVVLSCFFLRKQVALRFFSDGLPVDRHHRKLHSAKLQVNRSIFQVLPPFTEVSFDGWLVPTIRGQITGTVDSLGTGVRPETWHRPKRVEVEVFGGC